MKKISITNECAYCYGKGKITLHPIDSIPGQTIDERTCPMCCGSGESSTNSFISNITNVPFACPVCNGHGTVSKPPWIAGDQNTWSETGNPLYTCPACKGTCVVWEPRDL